MTVDTPMMAQWRELKTAARDAILLFRLGDFYEAFEADAHLVSKELQLTLTQRQGTPMCGLPYHALDNYLDKLIGRGYKVALAEQTQDPASTKGLVRREIVRIATPGTAIGSNLLKDKTSHFFASIVQVNTTYGLALLDLTTGTFKALELDSSHELADELYRLRPAEFLIPKRFKPPAELTALANEREPLDLRTATHVLTEHFGTAFGIADKPVAICAAGSLLHYLKRELSLPLTQVTALLSESLAGVVSIDSASFRNLELDALLELLDQTATPMGGRLLAHFLQHPTQSLPEIHLRQEALQAALAHPESLQAATAALEGMRDLERLTTKAAARLAGPRDLLNLGLSLARIPALQEATAPLPFPREWPPLHDIADEILRTLHDSPPLRLSDGNAIRPGVSPELDSLRTLATDSLSWIARYQTTLREQTGIKTLKVGFTRAFGYYIEVSRGAVERMPDTFHRRQTLVNAERFTTPELKDFEHRVLTAESRSLALEADLFETLRARVAALAPHIRTAATRIARIDALLALATVARKHRWIRPTVDTSTRLEITDGRHPLVEASLGKDRFIPNDTHLGKTQLLLLTGPNMAGKSTYIRQVALLTLLAHMGSYIPAASAHIGLIDRLFSRIGAHDDLSRGQSTFMVEMSETAHILRHATDRSLVLLDEIGRGTGTYDGIAIASAVAEYLLTTPGKKAKTLFATHYSELTQLAASHPACANVQTAIQETATGIVFLRKIVPGAADKSYGIHVAELAGLPPSVLTRARALLAHLESKAPKPKKLDPQLSLL